MERFEWKRHKDIFKGVGIYHITFVVSGRQPLLGRLAVDHDEPRCLPSDLGSAISHDLGEIQQRRPYVRLLAKQLMPDHIHVLLYITDDCGTSIREVARGMRQGWRQMAASVVPPPASVNITPQMPSAEEYKQMPEGGMQPPLFEPPFFRTLAHKGQLDAMIRYIHDNPRRAILRQQNPDLFRIKQNYRLGRTPCVVLGNVFLADNPQRAVIKCSRKLTQEQIDAMREECLAEAANGTVYISGAISEGEKQICKALREAGYPLIILLTEGFPEPDSPHHKYYKPGGVYFEACAAGKLLIVQPEKEVLERSDIEEKVTDKVGNIPHESQRYRFVAMNVIAEDIACSAE